MRAAPALTVSLEEAMDELVGVVVGIGEQDPEALRILSRGLSRLVHDDGRVHRPTLDKFLDQVRRTLRGGSLH